MSTFKEYFEQKMLTESSKQGINKSVIDELGKIKGIDLDSLIFWETESKSDGEWVNNNLNVHAINEIEIHFLAKINGVEVDKKIKYPMTEKLMRPIKIEPYSSYDKKRMADEDRYFKRGYFKVLFCYWEDFKKEINSSGIKITDLPIDGRIGYYDLLKGFPNLEKFYKKSTDKFYKNVFLGLVKDLVDELNGNAKSNTKRVDVYKIEGRWSSYASGPKAGTKDQGFISIRDKNDLKKYLVSKLGDIVNKIEPLEMRVTTPYNRSNPYTMDSYKVTLENGTVFTVIRSYGCPNWSGNVDYIEDIEVRDIQ